MPIFLRPHIDLKTDAPSHLPYLSGQHADFPVDALNSTISFSKVGGPFDTVTGGLSTVGAFVAPAEGVVTDQGGAFDLITHA